MEPNIRLVDPRDFTRGLRAEEAIDQRRRRRVHHLLQASIVVLSTLALWFITSGDSRAVGAGCVIGLISQPFWIAATWRARPRQWGMFLLAIVYSALWLRGIVNHFL